MLNKSFSSCSLENNDYLKDYGSDTESEEEGDYDNKYFHNKKKELLKKKQYGKIKRFILYNFPSTRLDHITGGLRKQGVLPVKYQIIEYDIKKKQTIDKVEVKFYLGLHIIVNCWVLPNNNSITVELIDDQISSDKSMTLDCPICDYHECFCCPNMLMPFEEDYNIFYGATRNNPITIENIKLQPNYYKLKVAKKQTPKPKTLKSKKHIPVK